MKVNSKAAQPLLSNNMKKAQSPKAGAKDKMGMQKQIADATKVDLSPRAKEINKAMKVAKEHKTDEAKIARLQNMVDRGEYKVESDKVADRLVNEHMIFRS